MEQKPFKIVTLKSLMIALLAVLLIRGFLFESIVVASDQPTHTLQVGDRLVVNKWSYGLRLPFTWIALPFFHDTIRPFGVASYSTLLTSDYHRIGRALPRSGDLLLVNLPTVGLATSCPIDRLPLHVTRCAAGPGERLDLRIDSLSEQVRLPRKGERIPLTAANIIRYGELICRFEMPNATLHNGQLWNNQQLVNAWVVRSNYFGFLISEKPQPSYTLLPEEYLIGRAFRIWPLRRNSYTKQ